MRKISDNIYTENGILKKKSLRTPYRVHGLIKE